MILQALELTLPFPESLAGAAIGPGQHCGTLKVVHDFDGGCQITFVMLLRKHTAMSGGAFEGSMLPLLSMKEDSMAVRSLRSAPSMLSDLVCETIPRIHQNLHHAHALNRAVCIGKEFLASKMLRRPHTTINNIRRAAVPCNSHGDSAPGHFLQHTFTAAVCLIEFYKDV